ncbi:MAG: response regulator [Actinomycetota bacterium]
MNEATPERATVVIVEDHTLVRQSLVKAVSAERWFSVVGEAGRGDEAIEVIARTEPDIVLLDITMPGQNGLELAAYLRRQHPKVRILILTMHEDDSHVARAMEVGVDGYVVKTATTEELITALLTVRAGGTFLSPTVARSVVERVGARSQPSSLTPRELEILRLLAAGKRPVEIGESLFLSLKTVKNHLTSIYTKLEVQSAAQAVAEAYRRGLVSSQPTS